jgi:hypothetical protein
MSPLRQWAIEAGLLRPGRPYQGGDPTPYTVNPAPTFSLDDAGRIEAKRVSALPPWQTAERR